MLSGPSARWCGRCSVLQSVSLGILKCVLCATPVVSLLGQFSCTSFVFYRLCSPSHTIWNRCLKHLHPRAIVYSHPEAVPFWTTALCQRRSSVGNSLILLGLFPWCVMSNACLTRAMRASFVSTDGHMMEIMESVCNGFNYFSTSLVLSKCD